jgi:hypothetical protein
LKLDLRTKTLGTLLAVGGASVLGSVAYLNRSATEQVVNLSIEKANTLSTQIRQMRGYYTKNVVGPAKAAKLKISQDHKGVDGCIPLPATMVHELNKLTNANRRGLLGQTLQ